MYHTQVAGYDVIFPYEPYSIQKAYMGRLLDCLKNQKNGLLESPTGTGKTLSILCAAMAWLDIQEEKNAFGVGDAKMDQVMDDEITLIEEKGKPNGLSNRLKIIYSSRTHVQLAQAMKELKRTYYADRPAIILGSRDQLCIHSEVKKLVSNSLKNQACRTKIAQHACHFYEGYERKAAKAFDENQVIDIEDLVTKGTSGSFCPYYASRLHKSKAQVVFTPYNYLLVPSLRKSQGIELDNSIVIFDEGHNIESICEDSASTKIDSTMLALCMNELKVLLEKAKNEIENQDQTEDAYEAVKLVDDINTLGIDNIVNLKNILHDIENEIDSQLTPMPKEKHKELHCNWMIELLRDKLCLNGEHMGQITTTIDKIGLILSSSTHPLTGSKIIAFESLGDFFKTLAPLVSRSLESDDILSTPSNFENDFRKKFRLSLSMDEGPRKFAPKKENGFWAAVKVEEETTSWILNIYCMSPSVAIKQLMDCGVKSIIITSGTLAPMTSFQAEMEIPFAVRLENRHVIRDDQLKVRVVSHFKNGVEMNSKFTNRDNMKYYTALGDTIVEYSKIIPGGILVFFSSYGIMNKTLELWKQIGWRIWDQLSEEKVIYIEPKDKYAFADNVTKYKAIIDESRYDKSKKGAIFFGVTRGKLSEGMDIGNDYCRGVIIIGLPFPSCFDERSLLKKSYIRSRSDLNFSFDEYYSLQMKRGLNQSIGRVIRHKDDYGVVLLCDYRFETHRNSLSKWIQPFFSAQSDYAKVKNEITSFFENRSELGAQDSCSVEVIEDGEEMISLKKSVPKFQNPLKLTASAEVRRQHDKEIASQYFVATQSSTQSIASSSSSSSPTSSRNGFNSHQPKKFFDIFKKNQVERICDLKDEEQPGPSKRVINEIATVDLTNDDGECPISITPAERMKKRLKVQLKGLGSETENSTETGNSNKPFDPQLQRFVEREGLQMKTIFQGTNKFSKLCRGMKKFKIDNNINSLVELLEQLFSGVRSPMRDQLLGGMCLLVPPELRGNFVERLKIKIEYVPIDVYAGNRVIAAQS